MHVRALIVLGLLVLPRPAHATLITFNDGIAESLIGGFYSPLGVTFSGAAWQTNFGLAGFSGPLGLASTGSTPFNWDSATPVIATFSSPVSTASVVVLDLGENGFTLNAYDALSGGNLVSTTTLFGIGLGNNNFQTLSVDAASIFRVEMFQALNSSVDGVVVEDFQFATPLAVPEPATLSLLTIGLVGGVVARRRRG